MVKSSLQETSKSREHKSPLRKSPRLTTPKNRGNTLVGSGIAAPRKAKGRRLFTPTKKGRQLSSQSSSRNSPIGSPLSSQSSSRNSPRGSPLSSQSSSRNSPRGSPLSSQSSSRNSPRGSPLSSSSSFRNSPNSPVGVAPFSFMERDFLSKIKTMVEEVVSKSKEESKATDTTVTIPAQQKRLLQKEVHKAILNLSEDETPMQFNLQENFNHSSNIAITKKVLGILADVNISDVTDNFKKKTIKRYFHTLKRAEKLRGTNREIMFLMKQRRRQRLTNAKNRRLKSLSKIKKSTLSSAEREQLRLSLKSAAYISSEETASNDDSDVESDEENHQFNKRLIKKALPWRSDFLNKNYEKLDLLAKKRNYGYSGYNRIDIDKNSTRLPPFGSPNWAVKTQSDM